MFKRRLDANHMRVRFRIHQARKTVAGAAADALRFVLLFFVEHDAQRNVERLEPELGEVVAKLLDARLVGYGRVWILRAGPRIGRVLAAVTVHVVQIFGLSIVRLEIAVTEWPGRRQSAMVPQRTEILV